jgi:hypothetical protein
LIGPCYGIHEVANLGDKKVKELMVKLDFCIPTTYFRKNLDGTWRSLVEREE